MSIEACYDISPDLSLLFLFAFLQRIHYLDAENPFPHSKEKMGRFVGFEEHVGHILTAHANDRVGCLVESNMSQLLSQM